MWIYLGGFMLHLVFLAGMFDIYFKTPIVPGITSLPNPVNGSAKRLVFIVADGLRADSFFSKSKNSTPFLRSKIENFASWGVSHTRVPTESRPGIVALAAGIYEDPSAVFKGWKKNPAEFDTIFNQSHYTWAWGSPDIVPMFTQDKVETMSYDEQEEEFFGKNSSWMLDTWVFDHVKLLFDNSKTNKTLYRQLHADQLVFFLHLLGLDTAGHTIKPLSLKYQENLNVVDSGIKSIEELFQKFYNDAQTVFVFTADHGMTDWGSHGAGSKDETEVPLVVWGPGIEGPMRSESLDPPSPKDWQLSHLRRKDVNQADIVTLLASLLGCRIPVNSVGYLPRSYLDLPLEQVAKLTMYNAMQLSAQALRKQELVQSRSFSLLFKPFWNLSSDSLSIRVDSIHNFINSKKYTIAIQLAEELGVISIHALHYYHNYYQGLLLTSVSFSFLGWIAWLLCQLFQHKSSFRRFTRKVAITMRITDLLFAVSAIIVILLIQVQGLDSRFNLYCVLPICLWRAVFKNIDTWKPIFSSSQTCFKILIVVGVLIIFIEIMVAVFFQRWVLSVGVLVCAIWPLFSANISKIPPSLLILWLFSCASVAVFPLLPVIGSETSIFLVLLSAVLWIFVTGLSLHLLYGPNIWLHSILLCQFFIISITIVVVLWVTISIDSGNGLPLLCQVFSWTVLLCSTFFSVLGEKTVPVRLVRLQLALLPPYILLSVRHETLFLLALSCNLTCWLRMETHLSGLSQHQIKGILFPPPALMEKSKEFLTSEDVRRAALFVFYIFLSFFGTGNIASLNSFEITWVRCFVSVFSPFTMMILILFKMIVPFIIVSSIFRAINISLKAPTNHMFIIVLVICDLMGLQFLHYVTNEGSWLDIGTSISHYVIVQVTVLALVLLYGLSSVLTGVSVFGNFSIFSKFDVQETPLSSDSKHKEEILQRFKRRTILPYF